MQPLLLQHGTPAPPPERIRLRAGPLSMVFEPASAFLRYLAHGEREVLRGIYAAVRDRDWGTVPPAVEITEREIGPDSFRIVFDADCRCPLRKIHFTWRGVITGGRDGAVAFTLDRTARLSFLRNRIGFCILHAAKECAGKPCVVEKEDGATERGAFPRHIAADQPFLDMRAISHEVETGLWAEVRFAGDVFEMEDQRNWTDATFKTYSTPLRLPFPVEIRAGETVRQAVTLSLRRQGGARAPAHGEARPQGTAASLRPGNAARRLPRIGLGVATHGEPLTAREVRLLKAIAPAHLRADIELSRPGWRPRLESAAREAAALGAALELALFLSDRAERELEDLGQELEARRPAVAAFLVFHEAEKTTGERWIRLARDRLAARPGGAKIGAGTNAYFAELNRAPPPAGIVDLFAYSMNPQVHAGDDASLVETLEAQAWTVESARRFAGGKGIAVGPVTLKPRFNPDAAGPASEAAPGELPPEVDPRQMSLFGAGWTLGSLGRLAIAGAESVTYFETTGWRGVIAAEAGSPLPADFPAPPGAVFPMYHVFADLAEFAGGEAFACETGSPLEVDGMALRKDGAARILLANLTPAPRGVALDLTAWGVKGVALVRVLDETNALAAMTAPEVFRSARAAPAAVENGRLRLELRPFGLARVDVGAPARPLSG